MQPPQSGNQRPVRLPALAAVLTLALAVALVAGNMLYAALGNQRPLVEGSPGELLYVAAFSGFEDEWDLYDGQQSALIKDEQLELAVHSPQTLTWSTAPANFGDFDIVVEAEALGGPVDNAFGLLFRLQNRGEARCDLPAVIFCGLEQVSPLAGTAIRQVLGQQSSFDYFSFFISSDGYYSLWKSAAGETKALSAWMPSAHIKPGLGARNRIRLLGLDASYRFFINGVAVDLCLPHDPAAASTFTGGECMDGELRFEYVDDSLRGGKIGLVAQSTATGGAGVVVRFDNLIVLSPEIPLSEDAKL